MKSVIRILKDVSPRNPIMIEGLPGIGFVAHLTATYLIRKLEAEKFAEIHSPYFQDLAVSSLGGDPMTPVNELYFWDSGKKNRDLIILYGNTQALTVFGQYELCGRILDFVKSIGCNFVICLGGLKSEKLIGSTRLFCSFTDSQTLREVKKHQPELFEGRIFGMAGLLLGLASLRSMRGFCLLAEASTIYPDAEAAKKAIQFLIEYLGLDFEFDSLDKDVEEGLKVLEFLGVTGTKRMEEFISRF